MLALLVIYIIKGKSRISFFNTSNSSLKKLAHSIKYLVGFLLFFILTSSGASYNDEDIYSERLSFKIVKRDAYIGFINIEKTYFNQTTRYTISSEVNTKVIFNFKATGLEVSEFKADTLMFSSMYRKINGKEKLNHSISFTRGKYLLKNKNKRQKELFNVGIIHRNLVTLFFDEPINIQEIYSDKFRKKVKVNSLGNGAYEIKLPNKSVSTYHYENGKCILIEIQGMFYKVKLIVTS